MLTLIPALTFLTTALLVFALFPPGDQRLRQRLAPYGHRAVPARERALAASFGQRVVAPLWQAVADVAVRTTPSSIRREAALELTRAGEPMSVDAYLAMRLGLMLGLPLAYIAFLVQSGEGIGLTGIAGIAALFLLGGRGSRWWVRQKVSQREQAIERSLPSALDLITVCMEAGLSFDSGISKVVEKMRGPLSEEFERTLQEMQIGKPRRTALREMAQRVSVRDLSSFVAAIVQADQMGMSLGPVMRAQGDEVRTRRRQLVEEKAMKAPIKMLFPIVLCILPSTMLVMLGPAVVTIFTQILTQMSESA